MKLLLCALVLTIPFLYPQEPEPKVFDSVVTEVKDGVATVVGDSRNPHCAPNDSQEICAHVTLDIPLDSWPSVWRKAERGLVVQAQWVNGKLEPVAATTQQKCGLYDKSAVNAVKDVPPKREGCAPPASQFITDLLEMMNRGRN